jgi:hypothetical protein
VVEEKLKEKKTKSSLFVCVGDRNKTIKRSKIRNIAMKFRFISHENILKI